MPEIELAAGKQKYLIMAFPVAKKIEIPSPRFLLVFQPHSRQAVKKESLLGQRTCVNN